MNSAEEALRRERRAKMAELQRQLDLGSGFDANERTSAPSVRQVGIISNFVPLKTPKFQLVSSIFLDRYFVTSLIYSFSTRLANSRSATAPQT